MSKAEQFDCFFCFFYGELQFLLIWARLNVKKPAATFHPVDSNLCQKQTCLPKVSPLVLLHSVLFQLVTNPAY